MSSSSLPPSFNASATAPDFPESSARSFVPSRRAFDIARDIRAILPGAAMLVLGEALQIVPPVGWDVAIVAAEDRAIFALQALEQLRASSIFERMRF